MTLNGPLPFPQHANKYEYLFERFSTVVMQAMIYGNNLTTQPENEEHHVHKIMTINRTLERTSAAGAYLVDFLPILKYLPTFLAPFKSEAKELHQFEYPYFSSLIEDAQKRHGTPRTEKFRPFINSYFDCKSDWGLNHFEISYALGTLYEGGSGTTSAAMMSFVLAMWHHPDWQAKVQEEIDLNVGTDRVPSFDDMPNLPTLRAAIKETLRWRPVTPGGQQKTYLY